MKICYIVPWFPSLNQNTLETQQGIFEYRQVMKLNERGHEFKVISVRWKDQPEYEKISETVSVYRIPYIFDFTKKIRFPIPNLIKLNNRIKEVHNNWNPDLMVYSHAEYLTSLPILYLKNRMKVPSIVAIDTLHGVSWFYGNIIVDIGAYLHSMLIVKRILRLADGIHLIGSELCKYTSKLSINKNKTFIITRGVDTKLFKPTDAKEDLKEELGIKSEEIVILYVGRLDKGKGVDYLLQAAMEMIPLYKNLKFLIVGDGSLRQEYERFAKSFSNNISFTGFRKDVPDLMNISDIFVFPSTRRSDGSPNVILEASALGLPVVTTDIGEASKFVLNGETGIVINPKDLQGMVNGITKLIEDMQHAKKMGDAGRKRMEENYSYDIICKKIEDAYQNVIFKCNNKRSGSNAT